MGLRYLRGSTGPNCFESSEVRSVDGTRDIPYVGSLCAVLVPTDSGKECQLLGLIFDDESTLVVDCLHGDDEVHAFRAACGDNGIAQVTELTTSIMAPCPPPKNQLQVAAWGLKLFELRPT
jgi:hypothetical protein